MPYYFFHWTAEVVERLALHDVTPEEFECVVQDPQSDFVISRRSGRPACVGRTRDGRILYPRMTPDELARFRDAVAEESLAKEENVAAARERLPALCARYERSIGLLRRLRELREASGVSLRDLEAQTGIPVKVWEELESSQAPDPSLGLLMRYAEALGREVVIDVV